MQMLLTSVLLLLQRDQHLLPVITHAPSGLGPILLPLKHCQLVAQITDCDKALITTADFNNRWNELVSQQMKHPVDVGNMLILA